MVSVDRVTDRRIRQTISLHVDCDLAMVLSYQRRIVTFLIIVPYTSSHILTITSYPSAAGEVSFSDACFCYDACNLVTTFVC